MQTDPQEIVIAVLASMGVFILIAAILVVIVVNSQRRKFRHKEELISEQENSKRQLVQARLEVEEQTRLYIARELHDNIGALSSFIKMNLNLLAEEDIPPGKAELLNDAKETIKTLIFEIKQLSLSLNTDRLTKMSLSQLLQIETDRISRSGIFSAEVITEGEDHPLAADTQIILFRVCQELLNNIIKHAGPSHINVTLRFQPDRLQISISDNGSGFEIDRQTKNASSVDGSGLVNIYNRIALAGGKIFIESAIGTGTKCYIDVPFTN